MMRKEERMRKKMRMSWQKWKMLRLEQNAWLNRAGAANSATDYHAP